MKGLDGCGMNGFDMVLGGTHHGVGVHILFLLFDTEITE
jgi:hypothetical protein